MTTALLVVLIILNIIQLVKAGYDEIRAEARFQALIAALDGKVAKPRHPFYPRGH